MLMCAPDELTFMITIGYVNVDMRELYSPVRFLLKCCSVSWLLTISENKLVEKEETPACSKYHSSSHLPHLQLPQWTLRRVRGKQLSCKMYKIMNLIVLYTSSFQRHASAWKDRGVEMQRETEVYFGPNC